MTDSSTTLKINAAVNLFFGTLMVAGPETLLKMYQSDKVSTMDAELKYNVCASMFNWGVGLMILAGLCLIALRVGEKQATAATHFAAGVMNAVSAVRTATDLDGWKNDVQFKDLNGLYFNIVLFGGLALLNFRNWSKNEGAFPDYFSLLGEHSFATNALRLFCAIHLFFGFGLMFMHEKMLEGFKFDPSEVDGMWIRFLKEAGLSLAYVGFTVITMRTVNSAKINYALNRFAWLISTVWMFTTCMNKNHNIAMNQSERNEPLTINACAFFIIAMANGIAMLNVDRKEKSD